MWRLCQQSWRSIPLHISTENSSTEFSVFLFYAFFCVISRSVAIWQLSEILQYPTQEKEKMMLDKTEVKKIFDDLSPIRKRIKRLSTETLVVTFSELIFEALEFFSDDVENIEGFFILDKETIELKSQDGYYIVGSDKKDVLIQHKNICCYVSPEGVSWKKHGYRELAFIVNGYKKDLEFYVPEKIADMADTFHGDCARYVEERFEDVASIYNKLCGEHDKKTYLTVIKALATGDSGYISLSDYPQYCHPVCKPVVGDIVVDGGLDTAETPKMFATMISKTGEVFGFEPGPQVVNCENGVKGFGNITIINMGLSSQKGVFYLTNSSSASQVIHSYAEGAVECKVIDMDTFFTDYTDKYPTLIKLDIEGSEQAALRGARSVLNAFHPKMMVAIYHSPADYIDIPMFFVNQYPEYDLHIGHHTESQCETVLYAAMSGHFHPMPMITARHLKKQMQLLGDISSKFDCMSTQLAGIQDTLIPGYRFFWRKIKKFVQKVKRIVKVEG